MKYIENKLLLYYCCLILKGIILIYLFSFCQISIADNNKIVSIRFFPTLIYTRVVLESNKLLIYKQFFLTNPNRLVIDIKNVNINSALKNVNKKIGQQDLYIQSARVEKLKQNILRITFKLHQKTKSQLFSIAPISGYKDRLIIDIYPEKSNYTQDPLLDFLNFKSKNLEYNSSLSNINTKISKKIKNNQITIMLDPGHGGEDSGAIGNFNTREKDVVLKIAHRLRRLIEKEKNMRVYMTRQKDIFVPLKERVNQARKNHADLFISIHADASTTSQPRGSSVFALSTKRANTIAEKYMENSKNSSAIVVGVNKSGDHYLDHAMFDMVQTLTINDSLKFGQTVLNKFRKINKLHKANVEKAGFEVLKAPDIPSILVETAFISNIEEERRLNTEKFQKEVAQIILEGIKSYINCLN